MKFDDILTEYVGEFGRYQKIQIALVCFPALFLAMHSISWSFTGASINQRCLLPGEDASDSSFYIEDENYSKWMDKDKKTSECYRPSAYSLNRSVLNPANFSQLESCADGYKWDKSEVKSSAVTRWGLICEHKWLKAFVHSWYYIGQFFGSIVFGILADKFGRKPVFFIAIFIQITCGTAMAYVPYWWLFTILRFCLGFAHPAVFVTAIVIAVEMVGPSKRMLSSVVTTIFFATGEITLAALAYVFRYYDQLQLVISVPVIIFVFYYWLVPESARWLVTRGRLDDADKILRKIAKYNNKTLPDSWPSQLYATATVDAKKSKNEPEKKVAGFLDMFRTPYVRKNTLTLFLCWPIVSMAYYGLAMNPSFMGGDRYLSMVLGGVSEILVCILLSFTINILGRKFYGVAGFLFAGLSLIISILVPTSFPTIRMLCVTLGKMAVTAVYGVLYTFTPELFPTVIRMTAVGACSMIARFGGVIASYVFLWIAEYYPSIVALSLSATCILAAGLLLILPDTNGQPQIETIEEAENFSKRKQKTFLFSWDLKKQQNEDKKKTELDMTGVKTC